MRSRVKPLSTLFGVIALCALAFWATPKIVHAQTGQPAGQHAALITITAGTPIQITTAHVVISSLMIQPLVGTSTGIIYVCGGIQSGTPAAACAASANGSYELAAQVGAATSTVPGPTYSFYVPSPGLDLSQWWIDGAHSGDPVLVSWYVHQ